MYRFAAYLFPAAKKWGDDLTDIIIASGEDPAPAGIKMRGYRAIQ